MLGGTDNLIRMLREGNGLYHNKMNTVPYTKIKEKEKPLKPKQKKYARRVAETGMIQKSATDVGYTQAQYGSQLMRDPRILTAIQLEMDKLDVNTNAIVRKIKEGMNAYRVIKDGGQEYPDFHAQWKWVDMAVKIRGDYAPEKHQIEKREIVFIVTPDTIKGLKDAKVPDEEIEELLGKKADDSK